MNKQELVGKVAGGTGSTQADAEVRELTAQVVAAYLRNNPVSVDAISQLIRDTHASLTSLASGQAVITETVMQRPAVLVKKSVTPDAIICLECGKPMKMLKRHLRTAHRVTPEEYLSKWALPSDYPLTAPNYTERRSDFAKAIGLGRKKGSGNEPAPHRYPASRWSKPSE